MAAGLSATFARVFAKRVRRGEIDFDAGRYVEAFKHWREAADRAPGDGEAEFRIARLYLRGKGVFQNFAEAAYWFGRAASRGHSEGKLDLAKLLLSGAADYDVTQFRRLRRDPDSAESSEITSLIFPRGEKVDADRARARTLLTEVADAGDLDATELLAGLCLGHWEQTPDFERARPLLEKGAAAGRASSKFMLGDVYFRGLGVDRDAAAAADHYESASEAGHMRAKTAL